MNGSGKASFRRILITGAGGFVAGYLSPTLPRAFPEARLFLSVRLGDHAPLGVESDVIPIDLLDYDRLRDAIRNVRPDLIIHLAGQSSVAGGIKGAAATWRVNLQGSMNLASACSEYAPSATFFFASSSEVYGESFRSGPVAEGACLRPLNAYARSKAAAEQMFQDILDPHARLVVVRPFNHIGPGQDQRFVVPSIAAQIAAIEAGKNRPELEVGNLDVERDFLDVRDVCAAYIRLLETAPNLGLRSVYNVTTGSPRSIRSVIDIFRQLSSVQFDVVVRADRVRASEINRACGDGRLLESVTGWRPEIPFHETLRAVLNFWRADQSTLPPASERGASNLV